MAFQSLLTASNHSIIILSMKITRNKREFKDQLYEQFARIGKALSNPHRLEIVELLAQCERTVEELATEANLPIANASHPYWRGSAVGVYRLWRDMGYAVGALAAGLLADAFGISAAIAAIGVLTFLSGIIVATVMREPLRSLSH